MTLRHAQRGNSLAAIMMFLLITTLLISLRTQIKARDDQTSIDGVVTTYVQLAQAQYRHYTDPGAATAGAYATTPALLNTRGYLPVWNGNTAWSFDLSAGLVIVWNAPNILTARAVQARLPNLATVVGTAVRIGFSDTQDLALLNTYVSKKGDSMQGALTFDAGIGNALDLHQNQITDVSHLIVKSPDGSAILEVNAIVADTVLAGDFLVSQ